MTFEQLALGPLRPLNVLLKDRCSVRDAQASLPADRRTGNHQKSHEPRLLFPARVVEEGDRFWRTTDPRRGLELVKRPVARARRRTVVMVD